MKTGDIVFLDRLKYGERPFRIDKVNDATYLLDPLDGGRKVRASKELVLTSPRTLAERLDTHTQHLVCGTLVRVSGLSKVIAGISNGDLGVVIRDGGERVNVAKLGGFEDRYARLPHRMLTVVTELVLPRDELTGT